MSLGIGPGAMIDSVKLELLIGRGGMGDIWQGINTRDRSRVAVKILRQEFLKSTQARERFRREAELTGLLNSAQTLKVLKYALTPERVPYIIMELLEGHDLQTKLDRDGPFSLIEGLEIMIEVLKALSEAHQQGIVHRDIKPSNLFKQAQSVDNAQVKILDFGLATQHNHSQIEPRDRSLVGTYYYMAPEQAERGAITAQTDLYAVGATLYALLTGHPPREPSAGDKSFAHFKQAAPKLKDKHPQVKAPVKLDLIIQRCLAIGPTERPENADVLRRALEQILSTIKRRAQQEDVFSLAPNQRQATWSNAAIQQTASLAPNHSNLSSTKPQHKSLSPYENQPEFSSSAIDSLASFFQAYQTQIIQKWTQAITERPEQSRLQSHNLKRKVRDYIDMFIAQAAGRPASAFNSFFEELAQLSFTHPPLELIPMITCSLFRRAVVILLEELKLEQSALRQKESWLKQIDEMIFSFRRQFITLVNKKRIDENNNALYRLFSLGSETPLFCTMAGIAINTHPQLRAALSGDEKSGLTGRKLFDILGGFQPITPLFQILRQVAHTEPSHTLHLSNESNEGRAQDVVIHPYVVGIKNQQKLLLIIDVISERSITEYIPSYDEFDHDYASPQALPWMMTAEVPALTPELLGEVEANPYDQQSFEHVNVKKSSVLKNDAKQQRSENSIEQRTVSHSRPIQKSGVWDNYQERQANELRSQRVERTDNHVHSLDHNDQNKTNHQAEDFLSNPPHAYQESSHAYQESSHAYQEPSHAYQEPSHAYQAAEPEQSYQDLPESYQDISSIPYAHHQTYYGSDHDIEPSSISDLPEQLQTPAYSESAPILNANWSNSPIPPDTQDYLRSRSSKPLESLSQRPNERMELDSQAPTDPPKAILESSVPYVEVEPQIQIPSINPPPIPKSSKDSAPYLPQNEHLEKIPAPPLSASTVAQTNSAVNDHSASPLVKTSKNPNRHEPITLNKRGPEPEYINSSPNAPHTDQPHQQNQAYYNRQAYVNQERAPIKRNNARITSTQTPINTQNSWLLNIALFLVFVSCLVLLRAPVTQWLAVKRTVPSSERSNQTGYEGQTKQSSLSNIKRASIEPASKSDISVNDMVTVKVNATKATFIKHSEQSILCNDLAFCIVPANEVIVIKSQGYKDLYLTPPELQKKKSMIWLIELEPLEQ